MAAALYLSSIPKPTQTLSFSSSHSNFFNAKTLVVARSRTRIRTQKRLTCTCLFGLGVPELVVIAGVAALVFGPKKLPEVGRSIGKTVKSFQQVENLDHFFWARGQRKAKRNLIEAVRKDIMPSGESMKCAISIATSVLGIDYVPLLVVRV
ncbi:Sec-independent protein translocase protein TATA, chloroplastic [Vitis vinifera]|uniref:Sec-independent protein translocase protein TATA, chloroplastic n=1 Tax=Vitis vinifera TaxID=29760 RepID=A0A438DRU2_VITVI|nr:Sec-independent protein translocase protein TATA, chloroplastic [Vitis vinifera]